jgi:hypothetical protein
MNITFNLQTIKKDEDINIETHGTLIIHDSKKFIIAVHHGKPIKTITINHNIYNDFIICAWCDLVIIPYNIETDRFVFKQFVKKQIDPTDKYYLNSTKLKFINNIFMEIGIIPNNPTIMYNLLKSTEETSTGVPIYNEKNKLAGIVSRFQNTEEKINIYCIPVNYILTALNKIDNTKLYSLNKDINSIIKINNYKTVCGRIYCPLHKTYITIDSFIAVNGDINSKFYITLENGRRNHENLIAINNNMTNNNIIMNDNTITLTSGFMHLLKVLDEIELLEEILMKTHINNNYINNNYINNNYINIPWNDYIIH